MISDYRESSNYTDHRLHDSSAGVLYELVGPMLRVRAVVPDRHDHCPSPRGKITEFSESSRSRMVSYLRSCDASYRVFATLTYPEEFPRDGESVKLDLKHFLERLRRLQCGNANREQWSVFWVLEFQERGAPHFHLLLSDFVDREWLSRTWYEIVASGDPKHLASGTNVKAIDFGWQIPKEIAKYSAKHYQKLVPPDYEKVGRFWGIWGKRSCVSATALIPIVKSPKLNRKCEKFAQFVKAMVGSGFMKRFGDAERRKLPWFEQSEVFWIKERADQLLVIQYMREIFGPDSVDTPDSWAVSDFEVS